MPSNTKIINIKLNLGTEEKPVIGDGGKKQFLKYNIKIINLKTVFFLRPQLQIILLLQTSLNF